MKVNALAAWHKDSYDRFIHERLPQLISERLPLAGYRVEPSAERTLVVKSPQTEEEYEVTGAYSCTLVVTLSTGNGDVEVPYADIPQPDEEGLFTFDGYQRLVVPIASEEALERAEIRCVGEQACDYIEDRLIHAPADLPWDEPLARSWLPLGQWLHDFLRNGLPWSRDPSGPTGPLTTAHYIDALNWLAKHTHLRRVIIPERTRVHHPSERGRVCPFEVPEGPNIGRVLTVANGADIRDGKLEPGDDSPEAGLGLTALMVPFIEHNDANRQLMGVNMMRQWCVPPDPEPALVQTGNEPDARDFWCGRNLLTAFVSWGVDTFDDGIVVSESCAKRLGFPHPLEPGDKLSNRHGSKGTVSRILPDAEMPHLADGTPVELAFSFMGCHTRLNFGQIREAVLGRIARAEGAPAIVPPFDAPDQSELCERLAKAGLPGSGMESLCMGRNGDRLQRPGTVGWVYWGKTNHLARHKLHATVESERPQMQGELEYLMLRDIGAIENLREHYNTCGAWRPDSGTLAGRVAAGAIEQAGVPTPMFAELMARLRVAGIVAEIDNGKLRFRFRGPEDGAVKLARPVPHPWLPEHELTAVGKPEDVSGNAAQKLADGALDDQFAALRDANTKLERMVKGGVPEGLAHSASQELQDRFRDLCDALLSHKHLRFRGQVLFSGRAVISPGAQLAVDQVGIPDAMAWTLFGPLVARETGDKDGVASRSECAARALDAVMARSWVLLERAPTLLPTSFLAFHPVRCPGSVVRVNVLFCRPMNADFDGDQAAVFLPLTELAQREAGELLSMAGHLRRDAGLLPSFVPNNAPVWGLAALSLTQEGRDAINACAGITVATPEGFVNRAALVDAMQVLLERDGAAQMLNTLDRLVRRGIAEAKAAGPSISPFIGASIDLPPVPGTDDLDAWNEYIELITDTIASRTDFSDPDLGPQLLAVKTHARGSLSHLVRLVAAYGVADYGRETPVAIPHCFAEGLEWQEALEAVVGARVGLAEIADQYGEGMHVRAAYGAREPNLSQSFNVLARGMRAMHPGMVFARAAATGEVDPLTDLDSRLFVGLPPVE
jgi:RNA polymerase Rpb2, domain 6/RNA polymerase Rpb1, domain 2/RNA polymerase Rpb2, domain 3